jgi:hypothetical protein
MSVLTNPVGKLVALSAKTCEIPPLESGDRLTRAQFMRRYDAMPNFKKAELIEGVVYVPSPVRHKYHGRQHHHPRTAFCAAPSFRDCGSTTTPSFAAIWRQSWPSFSKV